MFGRRHRRRLVRLHFEGAAPSIEGILLGRWGGHYVLEEGKVLNGVDETVSVVGRLEVPERRVLFAQELGKAVR